MRNKFNEVNLTSSNFTSVVGFDQFCKEAINYAYHDILNAEMEWPFLHQIGTITTNPGTQLYTASLSSPTGFTSPAELKEIDWDSFYINGNLTVTTVTDETHTVSTSSPYSIQVTNLATWQTNIQVKNVADVLQTPVTGDPLAGQYTVSKGIYYFPSSAAGATMKISYTYATAAASAPVITPIKLVYMDFDDWRNCNIPADLNLSGGGSNQMQCTNVFRPQIHGQIGFTPVPDKVYLINYEYWLDGLDLSAYTDVPLTPTHFDQIIIDGATKYCYEFREDVQLAVMAEKRFEAGVSRMRTELINRQTTMNAGFYWYPHGYTYTLYTPNPR